MSWRLEIDLLRRNCRTEEYKGVFHLTLYSTCHHSVPPLPTSWPFQGLCTCCLCLEFQISHMLCCLSSFNSLFKKTSQQFLSSSHFLIILAYVSTLSSPPLWQLSAFNVLINYLICIYSWDCTFYCSGIFCLMKTHVLKGIFLPWMFYKLDYSVHPNFSLFLFSRLLSQWGLLIKVFDLCFIYTYTHVCTLY